MKETESSPGTLPLILLSGDNARTSDLLHRALLNEGFRVQLASTYSQVESLWQQHRPAQHPTRNLNAPAPIVLLEVSAPDAVEPAVDTALRLKRRDPLVFIGYLADSALHTSGLAGDAVFPRSSTELAKALRNHFRGDA